MHEHTLRVLRKRRDIACVLVNPLQALHPNAGAPGDSSLVDSSRRAHFDRDAYTDWLRRLRQVCSERGIVLIFDEVFVGFRLAPGGAQEYFGVRADLVTYGKTLGGGLPVGVVCGRRELMKRFRDDRPADICFARGTFNSHPYVMGAMSAFLDRLERPEVQALYDGLDERWNRRAPTLNHAPARSRPAGARGQPVDDLDRTLHPALALQLDAAVLPARAWPGAELGGHRPADLQPELQRRGLRGGDATSSSPPRARCRPTAGGGTTPGLSNRAIRRRILGELLRHRLLSAASARLPHVRHRVDSSSPRSSASGARWYSTMSWKGSVRIFSIQASAGAPGSASAHSCTTRNSRPATPSASQAMPTSCT